MDPLMRKLFQPREAREKLRGMGGIMSSSPQLASTVAKFQQGGPIQSRSLGVPSAPDAPLPSAGMPRATRIGDRTFVLTEDGRVLDAQTGAPATPEVAAEVMRRLNPQLSMADIVGAAPDFSGGVNPSFREDTSGQLPPMPSDLAPMSEPATTADPRAPFDMDAFQRDLTGAGRAVAGPGLMAIDDLAYDGPFFATANDTSAAEAAIDRRMNADAVIDAPADGTSFADALSRRPRMAASLGQPTQVVDEFTMMPYGDVGNEGESGGFSLSNVGPNLETLTAPFIGTSRDAQRAEIEAQLENPDLSEFQREALETRLLGLSGEGFVADAGNMIRDSLGRIISAPGRIAGAGLSAIGATGPGAALLEAYDAGYYDSESPRYRNATESDPTRGPDDGARGGGPAAPVETAKTDTPVAETPVAETPVADAGAPVVDTTPPAPTIDVDLNDPSTYDTDFDEMMRRLGGATGKEDKSSRQKAMADLAMIGLAIAAGQSPDALTNIAQGALTGMKAIRAEDAAKDAVASETRALAAKLATDKEIARMRGSATSGVEDTRQEYLYNATFNSAFQSLLAEIDPTDPNAIEEISKRARQVAANAAPGAPSARGAAATTAALPEVTTQEQFDALPAGAEFTQNGQRRRKPAE